MAINPAAIFAHDFGKPTQRYAPRDAILYALGLGLGNDPMSAADLAFLDERGAVRFAQLCRHADHARHVDCRAGIGREFCQARPL